MLTLTDFTTYDEIRACLGLSSDELPDSILVNEMYVNSLEVALASVSLPNEEPGPGPLATRFTTIRAISEASRTTVQQKLYNLARLFSTYAVAHEVATSLSMLAPKAISDSKASLTRFSSEAAFKLVIKALSDKVLDFRSQLENINSTSVTVLPYFTVVPPGTDVVTG